MKKDNGIKKYRSLKVKTFFIALALTFAIGVMMLTAGFTLYVIGIVHENLEATWSMANAEAVVLDDMNVNEKCRKILEVYDSVPEEERGDGNSEEYRARFKPLMDEEFDHIRERMDDLNDKEGPLNAYIIAVDSRYDRMINLIDSDPDDSTFVYPGSWDYYDEEELKSLVFGHETSSYYKRMKVTKRIQATITSSDVYGLRCTGATTMFTTDKYTVLLCVDDKLDKMMAVSRFYLIQYLILLAFITIIAAFIGVTIIKRNLVRHIVRISDAASAYGDDKHKLDEENRYFDDLNIHTGDEVEQLADIMKEMEADISEYANDLTKATAEKERITTELSVASHIQAGMVPSVFPPYPDRCEFDIYASMEPAKEIGGDFYDYHMIDDDHLGVVIADVSGKGIPAALVMMSAMILIGSKVRDGRNPAEVLRQVNEELCENDNVDLFVTVWLGVLEISTGILTASNAGHEYPMIVHRDGRARVFKDKHGFVVGGLPGMKYTDYEIRLEPGQKIFVYTDGLTEATSQDQELFGMDRIVEALEKAEVGASSEDTLKTVHKQVDEFVGEREQFDDLTMLCLEYRGDMKNREQ